MSPRNFAKRNPKFRQDNQAGLTNAFVAFTHAIGINGFTYVPSQKNITLGKQDPDQTPGHVEDPSKRYQ